MDQSLDLFEWAGKADSAKRRRARPLGFYSALALVVKYGRLAQQNTRDTSIGPDPSPTPIGRSQTKVPHAGMADCTWPLFDGTARCPRCGHVGSVAKDFGARRVKGQSRPQSWCRSCRAAARAARRVSSSESIRDLQHRHAGTAHTTDSPDRIYLELRAPQAPHM